MHHVTLWPPSAHRVLTESCKVERKAWRKRWERGHAISLKSWSKNRAEPSPERLNPHPAHGLPSPRRRDPSPGCPPQTPAAAWFPQQKRWWAVGRRTPSCCHGDTRSASLDLRWARSRSVHSWPDGETDGSFRDSGEWIDLWRWDFYLD